MAIELGDHFESADRRLHLTVERLTSSNLVRRRAAKNSLQSRLVSGASPPPMSQRIAPVPPQLRALAARLMADNPRQLMSAEALGNLAKANGLGWFNSEHVMALWGAAILRADVVVASTSVQREGFELIEATDGRYTYWDRRRVIHRPEGHGSSPDAVPQEADSATPLFHPHRVFVFYHVRRTLEVSTSATQYLIFKDGVGKVVARLVDALDHWTSSEAFSERFDDWNIVAEVAALCEVVWQRTEEASSAGGSIDEGAVHQWLRERGVVGIRAVREELGHAADLMDGNQLLHVFVRLMKPSERRRIKGDLGACMQFLAAAEAIRRVGEKALGQHLPEEDQIGFGVWMKGARRRLYGTDRVFDGQSNVLRDYLTILGIDYGTKLRCYGEGPTEAAALEHALAGVTGAEVIDLAGELLLRGGKGVKFVESLRRDYQTKVFSLVLVDGDNVDLVRALRKVVADGECFPMFSVAEPDFELANFATEELIEIALNIECRADVDDERKSTLQAELAAELGQVVSGRTLFGMLKRHGAYNATKGADWGTALAAFALAHPAYPPEHPLAGQTRHFVLAAQLAERATRALFGASVEQAMIDVETGQPIPRRQ